METSTLRLFNAIQVNDKNENYFDEKVFKHTVQNGYVLDSSICPTTTLLNKVEKIVGISGEKANASFHKSWKIIKESSIEELVLQQIIHYITTYGFEALGIYREDFVYIPHEKLELPEITEDIKLTFVKAMTSDEILENIIALGSKIALSKETLKDMTTIIEYNKYDSKFIKKIGNRELKSFLYEFYDIMPDDPLEYLRYVIIKMTGETLLIKNKYLIESIKKSDYKMLDSFLDKAPKNLASIFFRYKPLFLAMKSISHNKTFFNHLRKNANNMHVPLPVDYLGDITNQIKNKTLNFDMLQEYLKNKNIYRKIRLAYALNFRLYNKDSIVYKVRNGRGWTTDFSWDSNTNNVVNEALNIVLDSIADDIKDNVKDKVIYIPENIHYTLPATEKQFSGFLPSNSYVSVAKDMIFGIHWENLEDGKDYYYNRVDLDLSLTDAYQKYGWDGYYRSNERDILFSGDVTDAPKPNGASELFYLQKELRLPKVLFVNYYNFRNGANVPCKIIISDDKPKDFGRDYLININKIVASSLINIDKKQTMLGLVLSVDGENRFYFSSTGLGNSISSSNNDLAKKALNYLLGSCEKPIELKTVLSKAGAIVVSEKPNEEDMKNEYIDLSPENLDKNSIINLLQTK
jgi:hypothetical protein